MGLPLVEEGADGSILGLLSGILIHPDTGRIEGFFVRSRSSLFVSSLDISRWGTRVYVRNADVVSPIEDRIRLQPLLEDTRTVLGQKVLSESGARFGKCHDVQFNTDTMHIEWIFPKKLFRWGVALPVAEILEVRPEAIIVKDRLKAEPQVRSRKQVSSYSDLSKPSLVGRVSQRRK